jgi:hypothetical protein
MKHLGNKRKRRWTKKVSKIKKMMRTTSEGMMTGMTMNGVRKKREMTKSPRTI